MAQTEPNVAERLREVWWTLRRWSPKHLWYITRIPRRRARWTRNDARRLSPYLDREPLPSEPSIEIAVGDLSGHNGLARAAQYEIARLQEVNPDLVVLDFGKVLYAKEVGNRFQTELPIAKIHLLCQPDTYAQILEHFAPSDVAGAKRIGFVVWENDQFPERWRHAIQVLDEVWVPSEFCASAIRKGTSADVVVRAYNTQIKPQLEPLSRIDFNVAVDAFLGLAIMDIQSCPERKNPWAHIRAWQAAFGDDPSKVLLMKIRAGKRTKVVLKELREMIGKARNIQILTQDFSTEEIERFQRMGDVFLSLHRSEGYGLVIHEMLMHGIPVLATDWSANHEFGPDYPNYFGVSYDLIPYSDWMHHYPGPSFKWADPSIQHAADLLREIADTRKAG